MKLRLHYFIIFMISCFIVPVAGSDDDQTVDTEYEYFINRLDDRINLRGALTDTNSDNNIKNTRYANKLLRDMEQEDIFKVINTKDENDLTPLFYAATTKNSNMVKVLLDYGADPQYTDENGYTPLHAAADNNCFQCAQLLVNAGADINAMTNDNRIPLDFVSPVSTSGLKYLLNPKNHK